MFPSVLPHQGSPGQRPVRRLLLLLCFVLFAFRCVKFCHTIINENSLGLCYRTFFLMASNFYNIVMQKMLEVAETPQRRMICQKISPHFVVLRRHTYGRVVIWKLSSSELANLRLEDSQSLCPASSQISR